MFAIIRRHPMVTFVILTYLFLALGWVIFQGQIPFSPLLAALVVVPIIGGRAGLKDWAARIVRWRVGLRWYAAAIFIPLIVTATAASLNILLGASATPFQLSVLPDLIPEAIFVLLFVGLGEEPGFRGFALPHLQGRFSAFTATLILSAIGVVWHIPLFVTGDTPWQIIPIIVLGYFVFTWLFNNTNGSVLIAMLFHTAQAIFGPSIFATMFSGAELMRYNWLMTGVYAVIVVVVVLTSGVTYLSTKPREQLAHIAEPAKA